MSIKRTAQACILIILTACGEHHSSDPTSRPQDAISSATGKEVDRGDISMVINAIGEIKELVPKEGEPQTDPHAIAITRLGVRAGPLLVAKITDQTPTQCYISPRYLSVGEIAIELLHNIYGGQWPVPDGSISVPIQYHDNRDYFEYMTSPENRRALQASWRTWLSNAANSPIAAGSSTASVP